MPMPAADPTLDASSFRAIADLAYRESGLILVEEKQKMIQSRLRHRLKALTMKDFSAYSHFVTSDAGRSERRQLISALTTNVSQFFRENHHFEKMIHYVMGHHREKLLSGGRLRIWSAGCSNGQEAYSIAMHLLEREAGFEQCDIRILGTDIDPQVVKFARDGVYGESMIGDLPDHLRKKYFHVVGETNQPSFRTGSALRNMTQFNELNLLGDWPMKRPFDIIFCRNVVIYFDAKTQRALWPRFHNILLPGGYLFLGHSERISNQEASGFVPEGPTTYRPKAL